MDVRAVAPRPIKQTEASGKPTDRIETRRANEKGWDDRHPQQPSDPLRKVFQEFVLPQDRQWMKVIATKRREY